MTRQIIAILRGITSDEAAEATKILMSAGIDKIEVPLNSPKPFDTIKIMLKVAAGNALIGAGTVLRPEDVQKVASLGGKLIVSPDCYPAVIKKTAALKLQSWPGVMTPTEAFQAIRLGATGLKLFPGNLIGPAGLKAFRAVVPKSVPLFAVGGAGPDNFAEWHQAGADGFGIGTALYKPGMALSDLEKNAQTIVSAYDEMSAA